MSITEKKNKQASESLIVEHKYIAKYLTRQKCITEREKNSPDTNFTNTSTEKAHVFRSPLKYIVGNHDIFVPSCWHYLFNRNTFYNTPTTCT